MQTAFEQRINLSEIARELGLNPKTLWGWIQMGKIQLPRDLPLLQRLKKDKNGRYFNPR